METIGSKLLRLKERSGLTLANIAKSGGYKSPSSIQRYFSADYNPDHLPRPLARRLSEALTGFGEPPIDYLDLQKLTDTGFYLQRKFSSEPNIRRAVWPYISCSTSFQHVDLFSEDMQFEVMHVTIEDVVQNFEKPEHILNRHITATYVSVSTMVPRYFPGEVIFYDLDKAAIVGQDALVGLYTDDGEQVSTLARIASQDSQSTTLEMLSPQERFVFSRSQIASSNAILGTAELLGPYVEKVSHS